MLEEKKPEGDGGESSTPNTPEAVVPAGGDKPDSTPPNTGETKDVKQEQINGLTIALQKEREGSKAYKAKQIELEKAINESNETINKLKNVFVPLEPEKLPETKGMTKEEIEAFNEEFWARKDAERKAEEQKKERIQSIKDEVVKASKEWNGENGKPLYNDEEVMKWQDENNKMALRPMEAFREMKHKEIVDWEVKLRMAGGKPAPEAERPSGQRSDAIGKETVPKTDADIKAAALEAMNNATAQI